jgi:putative ABC transport system permease protein
MITELLTRLRFLIFPKKHRELDEELAFHVEQSAAAKKAAGMSEVESRRQALIELGAIQATREQTDRQRPGWALGTIAQDVRYAMRGLLGHKWFSAAIIATIALGIGVNTMIFTLVNAVLYKPVPLPGGERLVSIADRSLVRDDNSVSVSYPDFLDYKAQSRSFEWFEATANSSNILSEDDLAPQQVRLARATSGIFAMVQTNPVVGRSFLPPDMVDGAPGVVVLSYDVWKERYAGQPSAIGRKVRMDGQAATIIGVMPKDFTYPSGVEAWMPLVPTADLMKRSNRNVRMWAILKPGIPISTANLELDAIAKRLGQQYSEDKDFATSVLTFNDRFNGGSIHTVFLMMLAAVAFVLLIACADVANMMLSRSLARKREMSIRAALGASRWRVIRQLLIESVLLSTMGGVLGLGLALGGVHWFDLAAPKNIVRPGWIEFTMDYTVFGYFAALCIVSGVLFGIAPSIRASKPDLMGVLKENAQSTTKRRGGWLSGGLVVFQFALTLVLLTGAGLFVRSLFRAMEMNPFVPATQMTTARLQLPTTRYKDADACRRFVDELLPALRALPGVTHASITSNPPGLGASRRQIEIEHQLVDNPAKRPSVSYVVQTPGNFETVHLPLLRGRDFTDQDGSESHEAAVVTQEAASRLWPGQNPLGKRFRTFDDQNKASNWITVVGVSANIVQQVMENDPAPLLFVPYRQEGWRGFGLVIESTGDPMPAVRKTVQGIDPELPVSNPMRLDAAIGRQTWFLDVMSKVFMGFALIALLMAAVGLYAIIAHATSSRTQEIGVRIALGATMRNIVLLVMKRGLWQISAGLLLGLGAALPAIKVMSTLPIGASKSGASVLVAVSLALAAVGAFACWLPARRAAGLDPVKAIRYE